jgi:nicotinamide-nucleotide amidase
VSDVDGTDGAVVIALLTRRRLTIAVAESLTGGLLVSELIRTPGASVVVVGGIIAYNTAIKRSVLGVDAALLESKGAVDPDVARQMALGVRTVLAVDGRPADIGIATTGVAGPDPQDGKPVGTVFIGIASGDDARVVELGLSGTRDEVRGAVVAEALALIRRTVGD